MKLLFGGEDGVEAAWRVVDGVIADQQAAIPYRPGTWGPAEADTLVGAHGGWQAPLPEDGCADDAKKAAR